MHKYVAILLFVVGCSSVPQAPKDGPAYSEAQLKRTCCVAEGTKIGIASGGERSTAIGMAISAKGGNVIDAAVATAFALAVERPQSTGLGGGGFLLVKFHSPQAVISFLDFRETAPHKAKHDMYLGPDGKVIAGASQDGPLAVAVPGYVAGLWEAHAKWGKLPWKELVLPAAKLAREGFPVYESLAGAIKERLSLLKASPYASKIYLKNGEPLAAGDTLVQKDLADTLMAISKGGREEFYSGKTAHRITEAMKTWGGLIDDRDLSHYEIRERTPVAWVWNRFTFLAAPPPSAGGVLEAQMLKVLQTFDLKELSLHTGAYVHLLAEVMKRAYADRSLNIGDPDFFQVPQRALYGSPHVEDIQKRLNLSRSTPSSEVAPEALATVDEGTTHVSVLDSDGNAVAATLTINGPFGSGLVVPGTGIVLNNEMDDFSIKPGEQNLYGLTGGEANAIAPGKRPVSSMSPTIVMAPRGDKALLAVGGAGGSRILSAVFQVVLNYLTVYPGDLKKAVFAPRMHHQWVPDRLDLDEGFPPTAVEYLKERHHEIAPPAWSAKVSAVGKSGKEITAVSDPRDVGGALAQ